MIQLHLYNVNNVRVATHNCYSILAAHVTLEYLAAEGRWCRIDFIDFDTGKLLYTWVRPIIEERD